MRPILGALVTLTVLVAAGTARAEGAAAPFFERNPNVLVFDNLAGVLVHKADVSGGGAASDSINGGPATEVGLLTSAPQPPFAPRLGYHRFFAPASLGLDVHYSSFSILTAYALAPRVGVAFGSGDVAFWLRAGVTYAHMKEDAGVLSFTETQFLVGGEAYLVVHAVEHFAFTIGPMVEVGVSGQAKIDSPFASALASSFGGTAKAPEPVDVRFTTYGLTMGVLFDF